MAEFVYRPVVALARTMYRVLDLPITMTGVEHLPATGGGVVAMNHVSYVDFIFAGEAGVRARPRRLVRFMAKEAVFHHPIAGPLMRGMHHIPVDRAAGSSAYLAAVEALQRGELVGVFPEATISRSYQLKDFKTGAARMAQTAGVPLIPVITWGGQRLLPKGRSRQIARHIPITVQVGAPLTADPSADPVVVTKELRDCMSAMLDKIQADYPDQPPTPEDGWWLPVTLGGCAPTLEEASELDAADARARVKARQEKAAAAREKAAKKAG